MILTIIGGFVIGGFPILLLLWYRLKWSENGHIKYLPNGIPILGHLMMLQDIDWVNRKKWKWFEEFNDTFGLYILFSKLFVTRDLSVCEDLLSSQKYLQKSKGYWILTKFLGNGLVTSTGDLWKKRRRMITPAFHFDILNDFLSIMENRTMELVEVVVIVLFGRQINPVLKSDFIYSLTSNGKIFYSAYNQIKQLVNEVIEKRLELRKNSENVVSKRRIFIDTLLDAYEKNEIDVDGILNEVTTFVNAGYETTATSLAWTLYCIGRDKKVQEKLYKEVSSLNKNGSLTLEDLKELKYLDLVIKESLRLHPVVPRFGRGIKSGTILGGKTFPECDLIVDILSMNRNPKNWDNPLSFIPERFECFDRKSKRSSFVYIPFSAGPRNCIGQRFAMTELKSALYHLVRGFEITSLQEESELEETFDLTHGCKNGLMLKVNPR